MNKKMFIISLDSSIVNVALEGNTTFLYEKLVTQNGINLEVVEINPHTAKCIVYGNTSLLHPNMTVSKTNNYLTIKFNKSKLGKVVDPNMNVISDGIFDVEDSNNNTEDQNKKVLNKKINNKSNTDFDSDNVEISLIPKAYNINQIGSNNQIMYTGIKVIDFCTPITFGCKIGVQGGAGVGKAQPLTAKLYVGDKSIYMKDVHKNTYVMGKNGLVKVTGVYPQGVKKIFRITFEDKRVVECCENHIWHISYKDSLYDIINLELKDIDINNAYVPLYAVNFNNNTSIDKAELVIYGLYISNMLLHKDFCLVTNRYIHKDLVSIVSEKYILENDGEDKIILKSHNTKILDLSLSELCYLSLDLRYLIISAIFNISPESFSINSVRSYVINTEEVKYNVNELLDLIRSTGNVGILQDNQLEIIIGKKFIKMLSCECIGEEIAQCISVDDPSGLYFTNDFVITHNTVLTQAILSNVQNMNNLLSDGKLFRIFCGIGERLREGRDMYCEFVKSGIIDIDKPEESNAILVYGNMDQPASIRQLSARVGIAISRYMMDEQNMNVLLIIDNIFRYNQAMSEISASLDQFQTEKGYHPDIYTKMSELQENIAILNNNRSITSIQAIYVPADDADDIGAKTCVKQQSVNIFLSRDYAKRKMFPAIDPLKSVSIYIKKEIVGIRHVQVYNEYIKILNKNRELQDMINMIGLENLSDADQLVVKRANLLEAYMTQPLSTSKQFMNLDSQLIDIKDVIEDVSDIINGVYDNISVDKLKYQGTIKHLK